MGYSVSHSLISGQPPLLVFTICLTCFGLTMVVLAYVIGEQEVPNPDIQMDWNKFFKKIASFKLCPVQNVTKYTNDDLHVNKDAQANIFPESVLNSSHVVDESRSMSAVLSNVVNQATNEQLDKSTFVDIAVKVHFGLFGKFPSESLFRMKGKIKGKLLGFSGKYSSLLFNISLSFRILPNDSCANEKCSTVGNVCLIMSLPSDLLPETKSPERCDASDSTVQEFLPIYFTDSQISDQGEIRDMCLEMDYKPDAKLTEMLSLQDRSIVNLHLMHTSYFMFVMVMTLVCYSLIKGRYRYPKSNLSHEKVPLDA